MRVFFGKISDKGVEPKQLIEGYYKAKKGSKWFNGIDIGDYCFMIGGKKIQLWKARQWSNRDNDDVLEFDILLSNLGINTAELTAFKYFDLSMHLIIFPVRSAGKSEKAFFPISVENGLSDDILKDPTTYKDKENFRKIRILSSEEKILDESDDVQLYHTEQGWKIFKPKFSKENPFEDFTDNTQYIGKGQENKDKTLKFIKDSKNWEKRLEPNQLSILNIYDAFCCDYKQKPIEEDEELVQNYWLVGATWDEVDKSKEFIENSEWINGFSIESGDKSLDKVKKVNPGDLIAIKSAFVKEKRISSVRIKAVGIVTKNIGDGRNLKVDWTFKGPSFDVEGAAYMQTIHEVNDKEDQRLIFHNSYKTVRKNISRYDETTNPNNFSSNGPKNRILFGPPGTGKTYSTISKAIAIANPSFDLNASRDLVKDEFERLRDAGQIVFTTFHQGLSYEEFIEGIKPSENKDDDSNVSYRIELGLFRNLCIEAAFAIAQEKESKSTEAILDFSSAYDKFVEITEESIAKGEKFELKTKTGGSIFVESISSQGNLMLRHKDGVKNYSVSKNRLTTLNAEIEDLRQIENINETFRGFIGGCNASAYWAVLNYLKGNKSFQIEKKFRKFTSEEKREVVSRLTVNDYKNVTAKPFVLIIDEINRGNVSQIFGELITLLEDDKRLGCPEYLQVTLPYSKETFGVPPNIYVIGTMNTADRSVEALDIALRRRFVFEEMPPLPELKDLKEKNIGINISELLKTMNRRLEKLLNKDHLIGHSFFVPIENLDGLKQAFHKNIFPLLQEYFYGDIGRAGLVVGGDFLNTSDLDNDTIFADFADYNADDWGSKKTYRFKDASQMNDDEFIKAINKLMRK